MSMVKKRRGKFRKVFLPILIFIVSVLIIIGYGHHNFRVYSNWTNVKYLDTK